MTDTIETATNVQQWSPALATMALPERDRGIRPVKGKRDWKEHWDPKADLIFRKRLQIGDGVVLPGSPVTPWHREVLGLHRLRIWWDAEVLGLAPQQTSRPTWDPSSELVFLQAAIVASGPIQSGAPVTPEIRKELGLKLVQQWVEMGVLGVAQQEPQGSPTAFGHDPDEV